MIFESVALHSENSSSMYRKMKKPFQLAFNLLLLGASKTWISDTRLSITSSCKKKIKIVQSLLKNTIVSQNFLVTLHFGYFPNPMFGFATVSIGTHWTSKQKLWTDSSYIF